MFDNFQVEGDMASTSSEYSLNGVNVTAVNDRSITDNPPDRRTLFAVVGVLSILCNGALCIVVIKNKRMLRNSYNVFILILALMDTVTGTTLLSYLNFLKTFFFCFFFVGPNKILG